MPFQQRTSKLLASLAVLGLGTSFLTACGTNDPAPEVTGEYGSTPKIAAGKGEAPKKLISKVLKAGEGEACGKDAVVNVAYKGQLWNGKQFDSSYERGETTIFPLSGVVEGWREGLKDAKPGSRMELVIPPQQGYGDQQQAAIPPNSTLVFVVDVYQCASANQSAIDLLKKAQPTKKNPTGVTVGGSLGAKPSITLMPDKLPAQTELVEISQGAGEKITADSTVVMHLTGSDKSGKEMKSTWDKQGVQTVSIAQAQPKLDVLVGKTVGSRIAGTIYMDAPAGGNPQANPQAKPEPTALVLDIVGVLTPVKTKK